MATSYFQEAFGKFAPHSDKDAAVKFALDFVLADERLEDLIKLLSVGSEIGGIEGEPGWIVERRDEGAGTYAGWPKWARYRAFVNPDGYKLAFPEAFYDAASFHEYLRSAMNTYIQHHPEHANAVNRVLQLSR